MLQLTPLPAPKVSCRPARPDRFLLSDVHLFDPTRGLDMRGDLLVEEGVIAALGPDLPRPPGLEVLDDLTGCSIFPGFVDIHAHLRTPGFEYKEDLRSASRAAAAGGYVAVIGMANTDPVVDNGAVAGWVLERAGEQAEVMIGQVGAVSRGLRGEELAELRELLEAGVAGLSDDGRSLENSLLLLTALRYVRGRGRSILLHVEDRDLATGGVMHEGRWSARLGLRGVPPVAESGQLSQILEIVRYADQEVRAIAAARGIGPEGVADLRPLVHVQHLSSAASVELLATARREGLAVTSEVTPHHLLLTDEDVTGFDPNCRTNPPLRSEEDRRELASGLQMGTIDCVATDHAPHAPHEKEMPFERALPGTVGFETAFAALYGGLALNGQVTLERLIDSLSAAPCRCLGLEPPRLEPGAPAHLCVADLEERWKVGLEDLKGKGRNSAFLGRQVQGRILLTVVGGERRFARKRMAGALAPGEQRGAAGV